MILLQELNRNKYPTTPAIDANLNDLLKKINIIRLHYGQPLKVTSGLRSQDKQQDLIDKGLSTACKSKHLTGEAVDIYDPNGDLQSWILNHVEVLEKAGLWCEDFSYTVNWVHLQSVKPKSGKRFFIP